MDFKKTMYFSGKKVIITGAASGIGKALAALFADLGATVILLDINSKAVENTAKDISDTYGCKTYSAEVNVSDFPRFKKTVDDIIDELGFIDIYINNAGVGVSGEFIDNTIEEINHITSVNYLGMIYGSKIILNHFYQQGYGHLVNIASVAGLQGFPKMSLYCGAKFGIIGFSQSIRFELKRKGIDISIALPSTADSPMITDRLDDPNARIPGILLAIPLCQVEKVATTIGRGIVKKKFMIFPTLTDRGALYMNRFLPGLFNLFINIVGFRTFKKKRERLIKKYR